jgi:hypothetical protein
MTKLSLKPPHETFADVVKIIFKAVCRDMVLWEINEEDI